MYIALPEADDEEISKINETLKKAIEAQGGSVVKIEDWGKRKLAYEIKHKHEGRYVLIELEGSGKEIAELERRMRVNDKIMRFITVRVDEDRKAAEKIRAKRQKRRARIGAVKVAEVAQATTEEQPQEE
ncbi:MAG: 30S ribosomal protein S6 [Acidobacteria bacterium]|jgi:small subunit ribosomal protein S6|nr:MAG: 30S ribosomal protein S6 [Acidobacteriota bacterium]